MWKWISYIVALAVGVIIGGLLSGYHYEDDLEMVQRDTVVRYDTMRYSRLELETVSHRLDVPKINVPKFVFLDVEKIDTVYKDNVMYLSYPRESYYTKTADAEIWHSGVDSTIDSLNVFRRTTSITETIKPKAKKHSIGIGVGAEYLDIFRFNARLDYGYSINRWFSVGGYLTYDILHDRLGAGARATVNIDW